ncbi:RmlC-like cupin domain superfamily [Sesbania bispinosa]|nr:RmlC-like cupin domain superfamily [Sesbania bispinosa]
MEPPKAFLPSPFSLLLIFLLSISLCGGVKASSEEVKPHEGPVVEKGERTTLHVTEYGEISAAEVKVEHGAPPYHLQFFTLDPKTLFLPVLLHADMVFYVHTGSGRLTYADEDGRDSIHLREGDLCSLREGSAFYIQSSLEPERKKLRIYAMFTNTDDSTFDPLIGAYSRIDNLVKGFDKKIMQAAFKVPEDLVEAITNKTDTPAIVHAVSEKQNTVWELEASFLKNFLGIQSNSKKVMKYNIFDHDPDFKNRNGWTLTVTKKQLKSLKHHHIGFLMVNLIEGSILGPHWNPMATEIAVVLEGEGMVRVVCGSSNDDKTECKNMRFKVKQGDVFVVPRFHPMAQMSFKNEPLVFLGFSTAAEKNHPQFVAGPGSVLHNLDKRILAASMDVSKPTIEQLLASRDGSIIFRCTSCAEEEEKIMKEEEEKEKEEEEKKKKEEEEKEREEEEAKKREKEKKREEEEARRREKERKREEEEARRQQQERERRREEEEARRERKREEEAESEEEAARRQKERREEEAESEEEAARRRQKERREEGSREKGERNELEDSKKGDVEKKKKKQQKQRGRKKQQEDNRKEGEGRGRENEEEARREEERRREKKEEREQERSRRQRERRREEGEPEEEAARRQQEEREERREEEERERGGGRRRHRRGERGRSRGEEEAAEWEEEEARRQQEERERRRERDGGDEGRRAFKVWDV